MPDTQHKEIVDVLIDLAQLDIDAAGAYKQALDKIDDKKIYNTINEFRNDHLRHIQELDLLIRTFGGEPPESKPDLKGYLIEGFTALRSITGTKGALKAMESNEKTTNKNYRNALEEHPDFPAEVIAVLQKNYGDEQRHLNFIQVTLQKLGVEEKV